MSKMEFTQAQQNAIDASGGSIIVSAAAGSGKTRVLVQRVINLLTNTEKPIDADRLLIVTFTKAAAEEMRSRIASRIEELLFYEPENAILRRQQLLLTHSDICTIHSFCSRIIRENFYLLDIDQDFRIASEGEGKVLKHRVMSELIEEKYQQQDSGFLLLSELLSSSRSDNVLEKELLAVYEKSNSHPFPAKWLTEVAAFYDPSVPVGRTIYADVAYEHLRNSLPYMQYMLEQADQIIKNNADFCSGTKTCGENKLNYLRNFLQKLETALQSREWDVIFACMNGFQKVSYRKPTGKKVTVGKEECEIVRNSFDTIDTIIEETLMPVFGIDSASYERDTAQLYPVVLALCDVLKTFDERYFAAKKERGLLDFSDLEHLMLRLLVTDDESGMKKTEFAQNLSRQYDQIMVDEYQDTNETQECIFRFVSQEENNLFVVGDIKQSIYRFREANPEIFKIRRKNSVLYNGEHPTFPAKIILDRNFRSRDGIIESINFVFHAVMSERVGEIEYNDEEKLTTGASYPSWDEVPAELHVLDTYAICKENVSEEEEDRNRYKKEAQYIARLIREKIDSGMLITEKGKQRPAVYGDFTILMRFLSTHGQDYTDILNQYGIPAYIDKPYSLFGCYEVNILLSLLKTIDNPLQDIPVLALLLSPVFGFTADDLADLKAEEEGRFLFNKMYHVLSRTENKETPLFRKCSYFKEIFDTLRKLAVTVGVSRVLDAFFDKTGYLPIITAAENGDIRLKNIRKFMSFVRDYESGGKTGLTGFVRYLNYLEENKTEISASDTVPSNAVKIMSIHHSKGLEFPVCILAGLNAKGSNDTEEILCHTHLGLGLKVIDRDNMLKFNTLQRNIISICKDAENMSEAMRVLYVAMTRAKEKLIAVVSYAASAPDSLEKKLEDLGSQIRLNDGRISTHSVEKTSSLADWLMMCAMVHPSMQQLRIDAGIPDGPTLPCTAEWKYHFVTQLAARDVSSDDAEQSVPPEQEILEFLEDRFDQTYRYQKRTVIPSKVSASALVHTAADYPIASSRPAFMQADKMTGTEKGTALHTFLQYADFQALESDAEKEKARLVQDGFLSQEQANVVDTKDIESFLHSEIYADIRCAERVLREYRFVVNLSASDIDPDYPPEESVILQGAMDCLIIGKDGIIIVDYKTDRVKYAEELAEKYRTQLLLYKKAAQQLFPLPVKKCCIYSIHKSQVVNVES